MTNEVFTAKGEALENLFFQSSGDTREKISADAKDRKAAEALSMVSGIKDQTVLDKMVSLGIKSDTLAALSLVPLVKVAWADGTLDDKERKAIMVGAETAGVYSGSHGHLLLDSWMSRNPDQALYDTWADYVRTLCAELGGDELKAIREQLLGLARRVAQASGGFTRGAATSDVETAALAELEKAFC